ncbi:MAG: WYL domain-containing protein [Fusobacteriaceae bacterium]
MTKMMIGQPNRLVAIDYTNWEGKRSIRYVKPKYMYYGSTKYHTTEQWFVKAFDVQKQDWRRFALNNIHEWRSLSEAEKEVFSITC